MSKEINKDMIDRASKFVSTCFLITFIILIIFIITDYLVGVIGTGLLLISWVLLDIGLILEKIILDKKG